MNFRVGLGYDVHVLKDNLKFVLGGIEIPHYKGCIAHSDGDVLIHALCDALLGAAGLRDIGFQFPDSDDKFRDIDSKILLRETNKLIIEKGYKIGNIDSVISLQKPRIKDYIPTMVSIIADLLGLKIDQVSIKATTTETLGFEGREEGVSAQAIVLIYK